MNDKLETLFGNVNKVLSKYRGVFTFHPEVEELHNAVSSILAEYVTRWEAIDTAYYLLRDEYEAYKREPEVVAQRNRLFRWEDRYYEEVRRREQAEIAEDRSRKEILFLEHQIETLQDQLNNQIQKTKQAKGA